MSTEKEREINKKTLLPFIKEVVGDNLAAEEYLYSLAKAMRIIDDIYDEDYPVSKNQLIETIKTFIITIPMNSFYRKHQDLLLSHHITMWNTWYISNDLYKQGELDKVYAHVIRDYCYEIFVLVALLTQGEKHMNKINKLIRNVIKKPFDE
jgi:hypothetical protein